MTQDKNSENGVERDDPMIAAEFALGLLEGEELLSARGKEATDQAFAGRKAWWDNWFAPLSDEVAGLEPSASVWARIEAEVDGTTQTDGGAEIIDLRTRLRRWQFGAAFTSMAAALALAFLAFSPATAPAPGSTDTPLIASADPLVAQVPIGDTGLRLDVTYIPESERMLIGAIGLTADGVHDHELWLVPADGSALQSLGVVAPGEVLSMELPGDIATNVGDGVSLVLTREPIGGKPEGEDAGPVVAQGAFTTV